LDNHADMKEKTTESDDEKTCVASVFYLEPHESGEKRGAEMGQNPHIKEATTPLFILEMRKMRDISTWHARLVRK
jgi:hypothetical protein